MSKEEFRQIAIDWQNSFSEKNYSYGEIMEFRNKLHPLAEKIGLLEEFKENGIL